MSDKPTARALAVVGEVLTALGDSTWRDMHPDAYLDLINYRNEMVGSADSIIRGWVVPHD